MSQDGWLTQLLSLLQPGVRQAAEAGQQRDEQGQAQAALRAGHGAPHPRHGSGTGRHGPAGAPKSSP